MALDELKNGALTSLENDLTDAAFLLRRAWASSKDLKFHETAAQIADTVLDLERAVKLITKATT